MPPALAQGAGSVPPAASSETETLGYFGLNHKFSAIACGISRRPLN